VSSLPLWRKKWRFFIHCKYRN